MRARAKRNRREGTRCFYCGRTFAGDRTIDHRVPRSRGGTEGLANLVFACRACNRRKADTPEDEFAASEWLRLRRGPTEPGARPADRPAAGRRRPRA